MPNWYWEGYKTVLYKHRQKKLSVQSAVINKQDQSNDRRIIQTFCPGVKQSARPIAKPRLAREDFQKIKKNEMIISYQF